MNRSSKKALKVVLVYVESQSNRSHGVCGAAAPFDKILLRIYVDKVGM